MAKKALYWGERGPRAVDPPQSSRAVVDRPPASPLLFGSESAEQAAERLTARLSQDRAWRREGTPRYLKPHCILADRFDNTVTDAFLLWGYPYERWFPAS